MVKDEDLHMKILEHGSLKRLSKKSSGHIGHGTACHPSSPTVDVVRNEIIADFNVMGFLPTQLMAIAGEQHCCFGCHEKQCCWSCRTPRPEERTVPTRQVTWHHSC